MPIEHFQSPEHHGLENHGPELQGSEPQRPEHPCLDHSNSLPANGGARYRLLALLVAGALATACSGPGDGTKNQEASPEMAESTKPSTNIDPHSFSRPEEAAVEHLDLDLTVDFEAKTLSGRASLQLRRAAGSEALILDTRDLDIRSVSSADGSPITFELGPEMEHLGRSLTVPLGPGVNTVHIDYSSRPEAAAVQWLSPAQTSGGKLPFLFTQSQAILARTWVPCQDSPGVRMTYNATIRVPPGLMAVMSAENDPELRPDGVYTFRMPQAIPSYLLALAVGDLRFQPMGERTGVYAEPAVVEAAAWEFAETEAMMDAVDALYGPYLWGRYDILVLPPSFPFGGMENPRLTFVTPTILAGDRTLVALIAHELAHSWSGNLVTNANWNDFWLNEGFTVYLERRIMEATQGRPYSEMLATLGQQDLHQELERQGSGSVDSHLRLDLAGRDPDDGMTDIAYEKGYFLLRSMEEAVGREAFDTYLRGYFERHSFQSLTTDDFLQDLSEHLLAAHPEAEKAVDLAGWIDGPGLPEGASRATSDAFDQVEAQIAAWTGGTAAGKLAVEGWSSHEWLHFLRSLPEDLAAERLAELDAAFAFTESGNSEVLSAWLTQSIDHGYEPAFPTLERFLMEVGRRKFLRPLYTHLAATENGKKIALEIYAKARPGYHAVSVQTLDALLGWQG